MTSRAPAFREVRPQGADHSAPRLRPSAPAGGTPLCSAAPPPPWSAGRRRGKRGRRLAGFAGRDASGGGCFAGASFKACGGGSIEGDEDPREHSKQAVAQVVGVGRQSCEVDSPQTLPAFPHVFVKSSPRVESAVCSPSGADGSSVGRSPLSHEPSLRPGPAPRGAAPARPRPLEPALPAPARDSAGCHLPRPLPAPPPALSVESVASPLPTGFPVWAQ